MSFQVIINGSSRQSDRDYYDIISLEFKDKWIMKDHRGSIINQVVTICGKLYEEIVHESLHGYKLDTTQIHYFALSLKCYFEGTPVIYLTSTITVDHNLSSKYPNFNITISFDNQIVFSFSMWYNYQNIVNELFRAKNIKTVWSNGNDSILRLLLPYKRRLFDYFVLTQKNPQGIVY